LIIFSYIYIYITLIKKMKESQLRQLIIEEYSKLNEDRDIKYNELIEELKNVCERYAIRLDPSDIKDALMNVSDIYNDY